MPSARSFTLGFRFCAAALAVQGILLWISAAVKSFVPVAFDLAGEVFFWLLALPALLLTSPFTSLLWSLGLMDAPGWFAWPKPLGIALVYAIWVAILMGLAQAIQWWSGRN